MDRIWSVKKYWSEVSLFRLLCYDHSVDKYDVKCGTSLRFLENNCGLMK